MAQYHQTLIQQVLSLGASHAALLPVSQLPFDPSFRDLCRSNACGMYGACWMCPPYIGSSEELIEQAKACGVPVISCLTTENKLNPARLEIADISRVSNDPFAKTIRVELRKKNVRKVKVLYSREKIRKEKNSRIMKDNNTDRASEGSGSISFVQGTAGMLVSAEVVKDLLAEKTRNK